MRERNHVTLYQPVRAAAAWILVVGLLTLRPCRSVSQSATAGCNTVNEDTTCNTERLTLCNNWAGTSSQCFAGWRNHTFCILPSATNLTGTYSVTRPHTSVAFPELTVSSSSDPRICYATVQLSAIQSLQSQRLNLLVEMDISFNGQSLLINITEQNQTAIRAFIQVCCHDINCFDLASLLRPSDPNAPCGSAPFTLQKTVAVTALECSSPPLPENGGHGCLGEVFSFGETCTYSCSRGHSIVGPATTRCDGGVWSSPPPECTLLSYGVSPQTLRIGESNVTGLLPNGVLDISIVDPLSEGIVVPVTVQSLAVNVVPADGIRFSALVPNQTAALEVLSSGDNGLLDKSTAGRLLLGTATSSSHYSAYPESSTTVNVTVVDSEVYVAEFILSAFHSSSTDVFRDLSRGRQEQSPSGVRNPTNVTSLAQRLSAAESGTLGPVFSCRRISPQTAGQIMYSDRIRYQELSAAEFSIDCWARITNSSLSETMTLLSYGEPGTILDVSIRFVPSQVNRGNFDPQLCVAGFCWLFNVSLQNVTVSVAENEWHHYAFAYVPSFFNPRAACFIDGLSAGVLQFSGSPPGDSGGTSPQLLQLCVNASVDFDLLRIVPGSVRFTTNTSTPFNPPHRAYHFTCPPLQAPANGRITCTAYAPGGRCTASCKQGYSLQEAHTAQRTCSALGQWSGSPTVCVPLTIIASTDSSFTSALPAATGQPSSFRLQVKLGSRVDADVQLPINVAASHVGGELLSASPSTLLFTPSGWHTTQTVLVTASAVNQRKVYSPTEQLTITVGPATGSQQYLGYPTLPASSTVTWVNSELFVAAFYLFSPWFGTNISCEAHSSAPAGVNTTILPTSRFNVARVPENSTQAPRLATATTLALSQAYFLAYQDRPAFRIGSGSFHLDFWASAPVAIDLPIIHYSSSHVLRPGISDAGGFSMSLSTELISSSAVRSTMTVCIAAECANCSHIGQDHEWKHYTISRDAQSATKCFINGQRALWNDSLNIWLTSAVDGSPSYSLIVGGEILSAVQSVAVVYVDLIRLYTGPVLGTSLTQLPLLTGELSLLHCGLITTTGAEITCNISQGLVGDQCRVLCKGARIVGDTNTFRILQCQFGGVWDSSPHPACELDCPTLTVPNGFASCTSGFEIYPFNYTCTVDCNPGYHLVGSSGRIFCDTGGMWSDPDRMCVPTATTTAPVSTTATTTAPVQTTAPTTKPVRPTQFPGGDIG